MLTDRECRQRAAAARAFVADRREQALREAAEDFWTLGDLALRADRHGIRVSRVNQRLRAYWRRFAFLLADVRDVTLAAAEVNRALVEFGEVRE